MAITVRYFARLRDAVGRREDVLDADVGTAEALARTLAQRSPDAADALTHPSVRFAVNGVVAGRDAAVKDGDTVDLLPPFSGG
jgi:molybdopterin synthase sulfur carrier subunit